MLTAKNERKKKMGKKRCNKSSWMLCGWRWQRPIRKTTEAGQSEPDRIYINYVSFFGHWSVWRLANRRGVPVRSHFRWWNAIPRIRDGLRTDLGVQGGVELTFFVFRRRFSIAFYQISVTWSFEVLCLSFTRFKFLTQTSNPDNQTALLIQSNIVCSY